jgi:DNA-binding GntR family transcriptional regulator
MVRETLRAAILRGDLPGDTRLVKTEIAASLGVSTTPVREAMRDLASEGLVTLDSHRVVTVRKLDWDEIIEIIEIRRSLERLAIERSMANLTQSELDVARRLAGEMREEHDLGSWVHLNTEFHSVFHRATTTSRLDNILVSLERAGGVFVAQAQRLHPEIREKALLDHDSVVQAYAEGDAERAFQIQHRHVGLPLEALQLETG